MKIRVEINQAKRGAVHPEDGETHRSQSTSPQLPGIMTNRWQCLVTIGQRLAPSTNEHGPQLTMLGT